MYVKAERQRIAAEEERRREEAKTAVGRARLLVELATTLSGCMRCPGGHPGFKDDACIHMTCTFPGCGQRYCYACGGGRDVCGGNADGSCTGHGINLEVMPGFEAARGDGDEAVVIFHLKRARAFVQVAKLLVIAAPELGEGIWAQLRAQHPALLSDVHGRAGNQLDWDEQRPPAELLHTFGTNARHKARRLCAQLTEFERELREKAAEFGLPLVKLDEASHGLAP